MMLRALWLLVISLTQLYLLDHVRGAGQTFFPASIPLSVRNPYLNAWLASSTTDTPVTGALPLFWNLQAQVKKLGWRGKIRVDGEVYSWLGLLDPSNPETSANLTGTQLTPTRAIFTVTAGPMNLTVTFLSPIEPSDLVLQSLPFTYLSLEGASLDGASHSVQVYTDLMSGDWASGDSSNIVDWTHQDTGSTLYAQTQMHQPQQFQEFNSQAEDGTVFYATSKGPGITWDIGEGVPTRLQFIKNGTLGNQQTTTSGPIDGFSAAAFASDLGTIQATSSPLTWVIGFVRDPAIQYTTSSGVTELRRPYYVTKYAQISEAIDDFVAGFSAAYDRAVALDEKIMNDAAKISSHYVDLVSFAARQTMGSLDITVGNGADGNLNSSDVKIFVKDIGNSRRVNPVERIYAAFPALLYLNASLGGAILAPLLESQDDLRGQAYASQDLGGVYPITDFPSASAREGVEQSGNMLTMLYAYARTTGDTGLLAQHYPLINRWAQYLASNVLNSQDQVSADGVNTVRTTNLAIKGIIALKSMAKISRVLGQDSDADTYENETSTLMASWTTTALSSDQSHILGVFGDENSWSLMYNIYADRLLETGLFSQSILNNQTKYYQTLLSTAPQFGLTIDSTSGSTANMAWLLFTSAIVTDDGVRDQLIESAWNRASFNGTGGGVPTQFNNGNASSIGQGGMAGPALGAMFAHLALSVPNVTLSSVGGDPSTSPSDRTSSPSPKANIGAIIGAALGGVAIVAIVVGAWLFFRHKRDKHQLENGQSEYKSITDPIVPTPTPFPQSNMRSLQALYHVDNPTSSLTPSPATDYNYTPDNTTLPPEVPKTEKARRHASRRRTQISARATAASYSAPPLPSTTRSEVASSLHTPTELLVTELRGEFASLRQQIQEMRAQRDPASELPPEYAD